jgi:predicted small secreted protein
VFNVRYCAEPTSALLDHGFIPTGHGYLLVIASPASRSLNTQGNFIMRKNRSIALTLLILVGIAPLLGACNTTAGAGRDISDAGHVITHDANTAR